MEEEKGEVGRKEVAKGGRERLFLFFLLWQVHTKGSFWSLECWAHTCGMKSKPSVNYIKYALPNAPHTSMCFDQFWKAPLGFALKKKKNLIRIPDTSTFKNSAPCFHFICADRKKNERSGEIKVTDRGCNRWPDKDKDRILWRMAAVFLTG